LPAFVNPEPLIREGTHVALYGGGEVGRVDLNVAPVVARADEFYDGAAAEDELLATLVPGRADWYDGRVRAERQGGRACGRACEVAEEGDEDAFVLLRIEVCEDAERAAVYEETERGARGGLLVYGAVAEARAEPF